MSQRIQTELVNIANEIEDKGYVTDEIKEKLQQLLSNASMLIALGPTTVMTRNNSEDERMLADEKDTELYTDIVANEAFSNIFKSEDWGQAEVKLEKVDYKGSIVPGLRVRWSDKVRFVKDWHNKEVFSQQISPYLAQLELFIAPKWLEWRVELE